MKRHLPGVVRHLFGFYFWHIWKKTIQPFWRCQLIYTANSAQIWRNFLPVYHRQPFKEAGCFIFQYVKNKAQIGSEQPQASGVACSLILPNISFKWSVTNLQSKRFKSCMFWHSTSLLYRIDLHSVFGSWTQALNMEDWSIGADIDDHIVTSGVENLKK